MSFRGEVGGGPRGKRGRKWGDRVGRGGIWMFILKALGSPEICSGSHSQGKSSHWLLWESGNSGPVRRLKAHKHTSRSREARFVAFIQLFLAVVKPR